jgi:hypothetical protein
MLLHQNCFVHSSVILRRNAVEKAGLYNEKLFPPIGDDYELWLRIGALGECWNLTEPLVAFRKTPLMYYSKLDRHDNYKAAANVFEAALSGVDGIPSPLSYPENAHLAAACRHERDFYLSRPRFLGRLRHELRTKIKNYFYSKKKWNHE